MDIDEVVDALKRGELNPDVSNEGAYKAAWQALAASEDPFLAALIGGAMADRLSWVFIAAYQSAVRACFVGIPQGYLSAFAVSEDREGKLPGTSLSDDGLLSGCKSWIAASRSVDHLVVTIGPDLKQDPVSVTVGEGTQLSHRDTHQEKAKFLGDMSQGFAKFLDVAVEPIQQHRARDFGVAEPFYLVVAGAGYLLRESLRLGDHELFDQALSVLEPQQQLHDGDFSGDLQTLLMSYQQIADASKTCANKSVEAGGPLALDWQANGRLLGMYGRSLRSKASPDETA